MSLFKSKKCFYRCVVFSQPTQRSLVAMVSSLERYDTSGTEARWKNAFKETLVSALAEGLLFFIVSIILSFGYCEHVRYTDR